MNEAIFKRIAYLLGGVGIAALAYSQRLMFQAGCAGDTKGGALGDPTLALQIESHASLLQILGLLCASCLVAYLTRRVKGGPITYAVAFIIVGLVGLWFIGTELEFQGVRSCFR